MTHVECQRESSVLSEQVQKNTFCNLSGENHAESFPSLCWGAVQWPSHPIPTHPTGHTHVLGTSAQEELVLADNAIPLHPLFDFILKNRLVGTTFAVPDN